MTKLEGFIKEAVGTKYHLNAAKLLKRKVDQEEEGYFCSELVAACYKNMGLLPQDKVASSYWPGDFSQEKGLKLLRDSRLSEEKLITF